MENENAEIRGIKVGDEAVYDMEITKEAVQTFADVTGDHNPVHLDEEYAKDTMFKKCIAHGMLSAGLISKVIGTQLPGYGTIYLGQTLNFKRPVYIGDTITTVVTVQKMKPEKNILTLDTVCKNQDGKVVIDGEATVMIPDPIENPKKQHKD